jgi:hypothetical protein
MAAAGLPGFNPLDKEAQSNHFDNKPYPVGRQISGSAAVTRRWLAATVTMEADMPRLLTGQELKHPCVGQRPEAAAYRCDAVGLHKAASTIRGLLEERAALLAVVRTSKDVTSTEHARAVDAAAALLSLRGLSPIA